jgi:transposase
MTRFIGIDIHKASTTVAVVGSSGRLLSTHVVETSSRPLVEAVKLVRKPRYLCFEDCAQTQWLVELLEPHVEEIAVARSSVKEESSNDASDAFALAEALRTGRVKTGVHRPRGKMVALRSLSTTYTKMTRDMVRTKNRVQTLFRSRGVFTPTGDGKLYRPQAREQWLASLPAALSPSAKLLFQELDALTTLKATAQTQFVAEAKKHAIFNILRTCPGMGPVRVAQAMAITIDPHRFRTKRQYWSYSGFSVVTRTSSEWKPTPDGWMKAKAPMTRGLTRKGNRQLKAVFKGAVKTAKRWSPEVARHFERLTQTMNPDLAELTIARKLAAITLAMWKNQEVYDPKKYSSA